MKKPFLLLLLISIISGNTINAQSIEELTAQKEAKAAELAKLEAEMGEVAGKVATLKSEVAGLAEKLTPYPRWDNGLLGTLGLNVSKFNDWLSKDNPNTTAVTIGTTMNGFANAEFEKAFWRNSFNLTLGWLKFDNEDVPDDEENKDFQVAADAFNVTSLYGFKLTDKWAVSTLAEYRTAMLDGKFNDPGYLDFGMGITWTPMKDMVVVIHPANYNFVFSDSDFDFESSFGAKIVADYTAKITKHIAWKSNLSSFISYQDTELNNWTWVNGLSTAVKGVGIGFDIGLRGNKQEALAAEKSDNPLQTYWLLGFSYAISSKK